MEKEKTISNTQVRFIAPIYLYNMLQVSFASSRTLDICLSSILDTITKTNTFATRFMLSQE